MRRERFLEVALTVVGVIFVLLAYPTGMFMRGAPALSMMLSLYVTLGFFLLLPFAIRRTAAS